MRPGRAATALVATVGLAALCCGSASAAGWASLGTLTPPPGGIYGDPRIALDGQGDLWLSATSGEDVLVFERPPGGTLTPVLDLPRGVTVVTPAIAAGADGTVAVAWLEFGSGGSSVQAIVRPPGGVFTAPQQLVTTTSQIPTATVLPDGTALVAFAGSGSVSVATRPPGGSFASLPVAGQDAPSAMPLIASNPAGAAIVAWADSPSNTKVRIAEADRPAGGTIGSAHNVTTRTLLMSELNQDAIPFSLSIDGAGDALVAWVMTGNTSAQTGTAIVQAAGRPAGQPSFDAAQTLDTLTSDATSGVNSLATTLQSDGNATALWVDRQADGIGTLLTADATKAGGYAFPATPTTITDNQPGLQMAALASLSGGGEAAIVSDPSNEAFGFLRPAGAAAFEPGPQLTTGMNQGGSGPVIAADASGDAVTAVNIAVTGSINSLFVSAYDATPPVVGAISGLGAIGPAQGTPLTLSVSPSDALSGIASVAWTFGDGQSATGASVTHTWAATGDYPVTVTVTDAAGNTASTSTTVPVITQKGPPPGTVVPIISGASLSHRAFAVSSSPTATSAAAKHAKHPKPPKGTQIRFTLSLPATVTITITHHATGRRSGHTCRATTKRVSRKQRCTATVTDGTLTRRHTKLGANTIAFSGRIGHRALHLGTHALRIDATFAGRTAMPKSLSFSVVRA